MAYCLLTFKACRACRNSNQSTNSPCRDLSVLVRRWMEIGDTPHGHIYVENDDKPEDLGIFGAFSCIFRQNHVTSHFLNIFFSYDSELAYHHNHHDPVASFGAAIWCDYSTFLQFFFRLDSATGETGSLFAPDNQKS